MTPPSCARPSQVQRHQARGSACCALFGKPSACLRVRGRASSRRSRRRGLDQGEIDVGGGMFKKEGERAMRTFERSPDKARSKGRDVETTGGARARRGVLASRHSRSRARRVKDREGRRRNQIQSDARHSQQRSRHLCSSSRSDQSTNPQDSTRKRDTTQERSLGLTRGLSKRKRDSTRDNKCRGTQSKL